MSQVFDQAVQTFRDAKWLADTAAFDHQDSENLLPAICRAWSVACDAGMRGSADDFRSWLESQIEQGASLQLLGARRPGLIDWLGPRLLYAPSHTATSRLASHRLVGLASSRLGRRLDRQQAWFTMFRAACSKIDFQHETILTAESTTTARFVERAAELFNAPVLTVTPPSPKETAVDWLQRLRKVERSAGNVHRVHLSPCLVADSSTGPLDALPLRDRCVVALSDRLLVFHVRSGGRLETLVRARLDDGRWPAGSLLIALGEGLVEQSIAEKLLDRGAVGWIVLDTLRESETLDRKNTGRAPAAIVPLPSSDHWQFLTHCTRDQSGTWPDETETQLLDGLLAGAAGDRSAIATLERILLTQKLLATNQLVRGDTPVVSFTAVPLPELPSMRVYRGHLGRWDFEPYGICIRRELLANWGAKPVRYGDESLWESLGKTERPFFQKNSPRGDVDWSCEQEWRHLGSLDLTLLSDDDAMVFVPSRAEADRIAAISRWPVTVLPARRRHGRPPSHDQ